jgi:hypothetical protein
MADPNFRDKAGRPAECIARQERERVVKAWVLACLEEGEGPAPGGKRRRSSLERATTTEELPFLLQVAVAWLWGSH